MAVEPALKEALQQVGKKVGRNRRDAKSVLREALTDYFDNHPELFEDLSGLHCEIHAGVALVKCPRWDHMSL